MDVVGVADAPTTSPRCLASSLTRQLSGSATRRSTDLRWRSATHLRAGTWRGASPTNSRGGGQLYGATMTAPNRLRPLGRGGGARRASSRRTQPCIGPQKHRSRSSPDRDWSPPARGRAAEPRRFPTAAFPIGIVSARRRSAAGALIRSGFLAWIFHLAVSRNPMISGGLRGNAEQPRGPSAVVTRFMPSSGSARTYGVSLMQ
jgi:hypothetical protein